MAGITLDTTFAAGADLPSSTKLSDQLIALPSLLAWFEAETGFVTLSGSDILTMTSRDLSAAVMTAGGAGNRAALAATQFGDFSGAVFDGLAADRYDLSGITFAQNTAFSLVYIGKLSSVTGNQILLGRYSSSTARASLFTSSSGIRFGYGSTQASGANIAINTPFIAIASYDGTNIKISVNGVRGADVVAAGVPSTVALTIGAAANGTLPMSGAMADAMLFNVDIHADDTILKLVKSWANKVYGIAVY